MHKTFTVILLTASITLGGCAGDSVLRGGTSLTATIANPIDRNELATIENTSGLAILAAVNYRRFCYGFKVASLPSICVNRRAIVLQLQTLDRRAHAALVAARRFVRDNNTLSAFSAIAAARRAVADFHDAASTTKGL